MSKEVGFKNRDRFVQLGLTIAAIRKMKGFSQEKLDVCIALIREHNQDATIITTPWEQLDGKDILETIEGQDKLEDMMQELLEHAQHHEHDHEHEHHHHEHDENCTCGCHDHEHHHEREHHHHHEHDENCTCGCHDHEHHHEHEHHHDHEHHHEHGHHHADEVFTSWGVETHKTFSSEEIESILTALDSGDYGMILRAKGMVASEDGTWVYFDYVPEEHNVRAGKPEVTGKLCVIGAELKETMLAELFGV